MLPSPPLAASSSVSSCASSSTRPTKPFGRGRASGAARRRTGARLAVDAGSSAGILVEDRVLQLLERGRRLDAELPVERAPEPLVRLERLGLAPRAVEREDQLPVEPLAERMLRGQRLELSDHVDVAARRQVGLDPVLEAAEAQLLEVRALDAGERLRGTRPGPGRARGRAHP